MATGKGSSKAERILAIDVGGTGLKAAIIDANGQMKTERLRVDTPHPCTPEQLVETLAKLVEPLMKPPATHMSIGFPGVVRNNRHADGAAFRRRGVARRAGRRHARQSAWAGCRCA